MGESKDLTAKVAKNAKIAKGEKKEKLVGLAMSMQNDA
jgi:hypothetical protein